MGNIFQLIIGNNNSQSVTVLPNNVISNTKDIYFTYGDSDFQSIHYNDKYELIMNNAFKLLLIFKPETSRIAISASSILTSKLTSKLAVHYKVFSNLNNPHFYILRKESTWKDYSEKRSHNTQRLRHLDKYKLFIDEHAVNQLNEYATLRKDNNTGIDTSQKWVIKANKILPNITKNSKHSFNINDLPEEILYESIFVWEAIEEKLCQRGILVPRWDKQLQIALLESYLHSYSSNFLFPIRDPFTTANYNADTLTPYYLNINLLNNIIARNELENELGNASPTDLLKLIYFDDLVKFKMILEASSSESDCLINSIKHNKLLRKAFLYASR